MPDELAALTEGWRAWSELHAAADEPFDAARVVAAIRGRLLRQRRRRRAAWLTAAAATVLVIGGGVAFWRPEEAPLATPVVEQSRAAADATPAARWNDEFDAELASVEFGIGQSRWTACQWPSDSDVLRDGIQQVAEELALDSL